MTSTSDGVGPEPRSGDPSPGDAALGYPVVLAVAGRPCLVVGGGPVAFRRTQGLVEAGARVTVVTLRASPSLQTLADRGAVTLETRAYEAGEAARYELVMTATGDPSVDGLVVADAVAGGVLVNSADGDRPGTVQLPAVIRRGSVTVAVGTGGASPALARWLSDRIAAGLPPRLATVATLVEEARTAVRASGRPTGSVDWAGLVDSVVLPLVEADRIEDARTALRRASENPDEHSPRTSQE
jgi:precorrin-2 dehydrogenase / sirohydrochlorin ferrochelatase